MTFIRLNIPIKAAFILTSAIIMSFLFFIQTSCKNYDINYYARFDKTGLSQPITDFKLYRENPALEYYKLYSDASQQIKLELIKNNEAYGTYTFDDENRISSIDIPVANLYRTYDYTSGPDYDYTIKRHKKNGYDMEYMKFYDLSQDLLIRIVFVEDGTNTAIHSCIYNDQWLEIQTIYEHLIQKFKTITYFDYVKSSKLVTHVDHFDASELKAVERYTYDDLNQMTAYHKRSASAKLLAETLYDRANDQDIEKTYNEATGKLVYERKQFISSGLLLSEHSWDAEGRKIK